MLSIYGPRFLAWLDEEVLPAARDLVDRAAIAVENVLDDFAEYVVAWRELLEDTTPEREHVLSADCWCGPERIAVA